MAIVRLENVMINSANSLTVGASVTAQAISKEFALHQQQSLNFRADILCSAVTAGAGITIKVQHRMEGGQFTDLASANASVAVTANGTASITLNYARTADMADMPLRKQCRLVITTGAGSAITIDKIITQQ